MRIITFCAEGIEQAAKDGFYVWVSEQDADIICIQDLKAQEYELQDDVYFPSLYATYIFDSPEKNTNGVAIYCKQIPKAIMTGLGFGNSDVEARYIQADYDRFSIGSLLAPKAIAGDHASIEHKMQFFDNLQNHLTKIRNKRREFIICGNWNIAHQKRDVEKWEEHQDTPGFLLEERRWMDELTANLGYTDAFRQINSDADEFTWWPDKERKSDGWRLDYQIISNGLRPTVEYGAIYKNQAFSNHAPMIMDYEMEP
jgi:exodeoxyribonuclease-3